MLLMEYDYATDIEVQREEAFEKGVNKGLQQGSQQAKIETAKKMLAASLGSFEQIAQVTGLSVDEIKTLQ